MRPDRAPPFTPGDKAIGKYLSDHAEKEYEAAVRLTLSSKAFGHAIAIPAQGEGEALAHRLERVPAGPEGPILIVAVINEKDSCIRLHSGNICCSDASC